MIYNCFTCPLGKDDCESRLKIYTDCNEEPDYNEIVYGVWCDKVGSKCGWYGFCDEAFEEDIKQYHKVNRKKSSNKRTRKNKYIKRLQYLESIANYPQPVMYIDEKWNKDERKYVPVDKPYYKRLYRANHKGSRYQFYKKYSNKKVRNYGIGTCEYDEDFDLTIYPYRKSDGELKNGGSYKKVFDYWWEVN